MFRAAGQPGNFFARRPAPRRSDRSLSGLEWMMTTDSSLPILVVDDYGTMVRIIRNLLKQIGYENVDEAGNGQSALEKIRAKKYGLVISDWNMEPMTGY